MNQEVKDIITEWIYEIYKLKNSYYIFILELYEIFIILLKILIQFL